MFPVPLIPHSTSSFGFELQPARVCFNVFKPMEMSRPIFHVFDPVEIKSCAGAAWSNVNSGATGFFRVKYDAGMLKNMARDFHTHFSPSERCMLMDDIFALAYSNYTQYSEALEFGLVMKDENHSSPWDCAGNHFFKILHLLESSHSKAYFLYLVGQSAFI